MKMPGPSRAMSTVRCDWCWASNRYRSISQVLLIGISILIIGITEGTVSAADCEASISCEGGLVEVCSDPRRYSTQYACGPLCVLFVDRYLGGHSSYHDIVEKCPPSRRGTSIEELMSALTVVHCNSVALELDPALFRDTLFPTIAHIDGLEGGGHFIVLLGFASSRERYVIYDPPVGVQEVSSELLESNASGRVIVLSLSATELVEKLAAWRLHRIITAVGLGALSVLMLALVWLLGRSCLDKNSKSGRMSSVGNVTAILITFTMISGCSHISPPQKDSAVTVNIGSVRAGTVATSEYELKNSSTAVWKIIRVAGIDGTCSCQVGLADESKRVLSPGETCRVRFRVPAGEVIGSFALHFVVEIRSSLNGSKDGPSDKHLRLDVVGEIIEPEMSVEPKYLCFGDVSGEHRREVVIESNTVDLLSDPLIVYTPVAGVHCEPAGVTNHRAVYQVILDTKDINSGVLNSYLTMKSQSGKGVVKVYMLANVRTDERIVPDSLRIRVNSESRALLSLDSGSVVTGVECPKWIEIKTERLANAKYLITARRKDGGTAASEGIISFAVNGRRGPVLRCTTDK